MKLVAVGQVLFSIAQTTSLVATSVTRTQRAHPGRRLKALAWTEPRLIRGPSALGVTATLNT